MSRDAAGLFASIVTNRFAEEDDDDFAATIDGLRQELAPTTIFESLWVEMALMAIKRLRTSAMLENDDSPTDSQWIRYQSMAEQPEQRRQQAGERPTPGRPCPRPHAAIPKIPPSPPPLPIPIPNQRPSPRNRGPHFAQVSQTNDLDPGTTHSRHP